MPSLANELLLAILCRKLDKPVENFLFEDLLELLLGDRKDHVYKRLPEKLKPDEAFTLLLLLLALSSIQKPNVLQETEDFWHSVYTELAKTFGCKKILSKEELLELLKKNGIKSLLLEVYL